MEEDRGLGAAALCVINRNGETYLGQTLRAALGSGFRFCEHILVDDDSSDGSVRLVERDFPSFRVVRTGACIGPAGARNLGFASTGAERVLFLDNDVALGEGAAGLLCRALDEDQQAVLAMPRILYAAAPGTIQYDGAACHFSGLMTLVHQGLPAAETGRETRRIDSIVTACFLVDRRRWGGEPLFDDSFFIYLEDHDLGLRTRVAGKGILSVPAAACLHREGTPGLSIRISGRYSRRRIEAHIRNRWQVILKCYSLRSIVLLLPFFLVFEAGQLLLAIRKGWFFIWLGSLLWLGRRLPAVLRRRARIQAGRRTPDREILSGGRLPTRPELAGSGLERAALRLLDRCAELYWRAVSALL